MAKRGSDLFVVFKVPSLQVSEAQPTIRALARLIGRQMAREYLASQADEKKAQEDAG